MPFSGLFQSKDPKPPRGTHLNDMKHPPKIKTLCCLGIYAASDHFSQSYPQMYIPVSVELHLERSHLPAAELFALHGTMGYSTHKACAWAANSAVR